MSRRAPLLTALCCLLAVLACRSASAMRLHAGASDPLRSGITAYEQGRYSEAEGLLRQATGTEAQAYLADTLAKLKKYDEAESLAKAALEANPTHPVAVAALGNALVGRKKFQEGVERMTSALEKKGDLAYAYFWRAQAHEGLKHVPSMVADYERFLDLAPKAPEAAAVKALLASLR